MRYDHRRSGHRQPTISEVERCDVASHDRRLTELELPLGNERFRSVSGRCDSAVGANGDEVNGHGFCCRSRIADTTSTDTTSRKSTVANPAPAVVVNMATPR
jgi:hypothetical protein